MENGGIWNNDLAEHWQITRSMGQSCALCCLVDAWYNGHDRKVKLRLEASFELSSRTGDGSPSRQNAGNVNISTFSTQIQMVDSCRFCCFDVHKGTRLSADFHVLLLCICLPSCLVVINTMDRLHSSSKWKPAASALPCK